MQTSGGSRAVADLLQEIVAAGGRALIVETSPDHAEAPAGLIAAVSSFVGPILGVVLVPGEDSGRSSSLSASPFGSAAEVLRSVELAYRWCLAIVASVPDPARTAIAWVEPEGTPSTVADAVSRSIWRGLLAGLRAELSGTGSRVLSVVLGSSREPSRTHSDPRQIAARIVAWMTRPRGGSHERAHADGVPPGRDPSANRNTASRRLPTSDLAVAP